MDHINIVASLMSENVDDPSSAPISEITQQELDEAHRMWMTVVDNISYDGGDANSQLAQYVAFMLEMDDMSPEEIGKIAGIALVNAPHYGDSKPAQALDRDKFIQLLTQLVPECAAGVKRGLLRAYSTYDANQSTINALNKHSGSWW